MFSIPANLLNGVAVWRKKKMSTVPTWGTGNTSSLSNCNSTGRGSAGQALCLLGVPLGRALTIGEVERGVGTFGWWK